MLHNLTRAVYLAEERTWTPKPQWKPPLQKPGSVRRRSAVSDVTWRQVYSPPHSRGILTQLHARTPPIRKKLQYIRTSVAAPPSIGADCSGEDRIGRVWPYAVLGSLVDVQSTFRCCHYCSSMRRRVVRVGGERPQTMAEVTATHCLSLIVIITAPSSIITGSHCTWAGRPSISYLSLQLLQSNYVICVWIALKKLMNPPVQQPRDTRHRICQVYYSCVGGLVWSDIPSSRFPYGLKYTGPRLYNITHCQKVCSVLIVGKTHYWTTVENSIVDNGYDFSTVFQSLCLQHGSLC